MKDEKAMAEAADIVAENGAPVEVTLKGGKVVEIRKCKVKSIGPVLGFITHVFTELTPKGAKVTDKVGIDLNNITQNDILQLIATSSDQLVTVVSNLCTLTKVQLDELELDDAILVITAVWEVNRDFFLQRVLPMVSGLVLVKPVKGIESEKE